MPKLGYHGRDDKGREIWYMNEYRVTYSELGADGKRDRHEKDVWAISPTNAKNQVKASRRPIFSSRKYRQTRIISAKKIRGPFKVYR